MRWWPVVVHRRVQLLNKVVQVAAGAIGRPHGQLRGSCMGVCLHVEGLRDACGLGIAKYIRVQQQDGRQHTTMQKVHGPELAGWWCSFEHPHHLDRQHHNHQG